MVVVGAEQASTQLVGRARADDEAVLGLGHVDSEGAELGRERGEAVGLVAADVGDAADARLTVGQRAQRDDDGRQFRGLREIDVDAAQLLRAGDPQALTVKGARGAHALEHVTDLVARLRGVRGPVRHEHLTAGDGSSREEGPGVRQVGLDHDVEGTDVARLDGPAPGAVVLVDLDDDARVAQHLDGHVDVRDARQRLAGVNDRDALAEARAREQECGDELGTRGGVDLDAATVHATLAAHGERQGARGTTVGVLDGDAQVDEGLEHGAHGALAGVRVAVEGDRAVGERGDRRQEPHHGERCEDEIAVGEGFGTGDAERADDRPARHGGGPVGRHGTTRGHEGSAFPAWAARSFASRRAVLAARAASRREVFTPCEARQARPGLPAVSAAPSSTPPTIATVRKKFDCLRARAAGSFSAQKASCM